MKRVAVDVLGPYPTTATAERLVSEILCHYGVPEGQKFEAFVFNKVCRRLGIRKTQTTPLHSQSDGPVE